jgi:formiminotetrahydrofolate cyclodeaminase
MLAPKTVNEFVEEVASDLPAPGGGSVSALAGALGTALTAMVCRLTIGKKKYAMVQTEMESVLAQADELRLRFVDLVTKDAEAFQGVMKAFAMPKEMETDRAARSQAIQKATRESTLVPLEMMELCSKAVGLTRAVAEKGNVNSISDAGVSALMIQAACAGAALNVRINLATLQDKGFVARTQEQVQEIQSVVEKHCLDILTRVETAIG